MSNNTILATAPLTSTNFILKATGTTIGNSLIFDNGTNVGIGTTSPAVKLDVQTAGNGLSFSSSVFLHDSSSYQNGLLISHLDGVSRLMSTYGGTAIDSNLAFWTTTAAGAQSEKMRITAAGNVGIGTSSPDAKLSVSTAFGNVNTNTYILLSNPAGGGGGRIRATNVFGDLAAIEFSDEGGGDDGNLRFFTALNASLSERMRITSAGNVGIGDTASSNNYRLVIGTPDSGTSNFGIGIFNSGGSTLIRVRNDGAFFTGNAGTSPYNYSTSGRSAVIESSGVLGYLVSTRESKGNIKPIENIDFINQLNPVSFNYRKKDNQLSFTDELYDNTTYGFIADEVEKVNKELVFYNEDGTLAGVEYNNMIAILTKAMQEQQALITSLQAQINAIVATK